MYQNGKLFLLLYKKILANVDNKSKAKYNEHEKAWQY